MEVPQLVEWMRAAITTNEPLKLTHFRIQTRIPIYRHAFRGLLEVLSHAPQLHTCVFEGLATAMALSIMFDIITQYLPTLVGLTIATYDDRAGVSGRSYAVWPSPVWEYAAKFSRFSSLQYFSWNNRFLEEYTSIWMVFFEDGYPDDFEEGEDKWNLLGYAVKNGFDDDFQSIASVFAAYCPTLQAVTLARDRPQATQVGQAWRFPDSLSQADKRAMEVESETESTNGRKPCPCRPPYLKLYQRQEHEERISEEDQEYDGNQEFKHYWKYYRVQRFFDSITGFHQGYLDLSGRHLPENVIKVLERYPTPKLQRICLHHLPVELLQLVYREACEDDVRSLSSTSKWMRDVGSPFIFSSMVLRLGISPEELCHIRSMAPENSQGFLTAFQDYATTSRQFYLKKATLLLSRSDLLLKLTKLSLINHWYPGRFELWQIVNGLLPTVQDPSFFNPTCAQNANILRQAIHLTYLDITGFEVSMEYLLPMSQLTSLYSVVFRLCSMNASVVDMVRRYEDTQILSVMNLHMILQREESWDIQRLHPMWYLLPFFTNIKTLAVDWFLQGHGSMPPVEVKSKFNPFRTIERFSISGINGWEVPELADWIQAAIVDPFDHVKFTHIKIATRNPLYWRGFTALLEAIGHAPQLHTCVFDGLATDTVLPSVFEVISEHLPHIYGLTVAVYDDMEDGYPDANSEMERRVKQQELEREEDSLDHLRTIAAVFAAYCSTLRTIVQATERLCLWGYHIQKREGKISFEPIELGGLRITEKWDTIGFFGVGGWPPIIPGGDRQS
ncbi:hypothetical protein CPB86DRAFT_830330 [Serendipita vermifera]|nr:hypothetical protein CPB86DRAFT_830330 [Serendipita vermifera]